MVQTDQSLIVQPVANHSIKNIIKIIEKDKQNKSQKIKIPRDAEIRIFDFQRNTAIEWTHPCFWHRQP